MAESPLLFRHDRVEETEKIDLRIAMLASIKTRMLVATGRFDMAKDLKE